MKRLEFYSDRYNQHQGSIRFAKKKLSEIENQITFVCETNPRINPNDLKFLVDIARLVIAARRSLSYTYGIRFYLNGINKQAFFDF